MSQGPVILGDLLTPTEFARAVGAGARTISDAIARGDIPVYRIRSGPGRRLAWGIPPEEVEHYVPRERGFAPRG